MGRRKRRLANGLLFLANEWDNPLPEANKERQMAEYASVATVLFAFIKIADAIKFGATVFRRASSALAEAGVHNGPAAAATASPAPARNIRRRVRIVGDVIMSISPLDKSVYAPS